MLGYGLGGLFGHMYCCTIGCEVGWTGDWALDGAVLVLGGASLGSVGYLATWACYGIAVVAGVAIRGGIVALVVLGVFFSWPSASFSTGSTLS